MSEKQHQIKTAYGKIGPRDIYGDLQDFLQQHTRMAKVANKKVDELKYASIHQMVLEKGVPCHKRHNWHGDLGRQKECFHNAMAVVRGNPGKYYYAEGFALPHNGILPVHHAWVVDKKRFWTAEITWEKIGKCYIGIIFKSTYALQKYDIRNEQGEISHGHSLMGRWELGFPELEGDLDEGMVPRETMKL